MRNWLLLCRCGKTTALTSDPHMRGRSLGDCTQCPPRSTPRRHTMSREVELSVVASFGGVADILATLLVVANDDGSGYIEIQQSIDDEGPADFAVDLSPEQVLAVRQILESQL